MTIYALVTNVGDPKEPWKDIPIEVIIEEEKKRIEEYERNRPRIYAPVPEYDYEDDHETEEENEDIEPDEFKVVIKL